MNKSDGPELITIAMFCDRHKISRALYYKLKLSGDGPVEVLVGNSVRILCSTRKGGGIGPASKQ